jgi:cytochrome c oxidase cbb3-type subunit 2
MKNPRAVVPESIMPSYPWLAKNVIEPGKMGGHLKALQTVGVPYSDEMIASAEADLKAQVSPDSKEAKALLARYPKAKVGNFDGEAGNITELDAVVAYLQMLGTLVDFASFDASGPNLR